METNGMSRIIRASWPTTRPYISDNNRNRSVILPVIVLISRVLEFHIMECGRSGIRSSMFNRCSNNPHSTLYTRRQDDTWKLDRFLIIPVLNLIIKCIKNPSLLSIFNDSFFKFSKNFLSILSMIHVNL